MVRRIEEIIELINKIKEKDKGYEDYWGTISLTFRSSIPVNYEITETGKVEQEKYQWS